MESNVLHDWFVPSVLQLYKSSGLSLIVTFRLLFYDFNIQIHYLNLNK